MENKLKMIDEKIERLDNLIKNFELKVIDVKEAKNDFIHNIILESNLNLEDDFLNKDTLVYKDFNVDKAKVYVKDYNKFEITVPSTKKLELEPIINNIKNQVKGFSENIKYRLLKFKECTTEIDEHYKLYIGKVF